MKFAEQPRILDGNDGLGGKVRDQGDLFVGIGPELAGTCAPGSSPHVGRLVLDLAADRVELGAEVPGLTVPEQHVVELATKDPGGFFCLDLAHTQAVTGRQ
jgi:hypothetical protein